MDDSLNIFFHYMVTTLLYYYIFLTSSWFTLTTKLLFVKFHLNIVTSSHSWDKGFYYDHGGEAAIQYCVKVLIDTTIVYSSRFFPISHKLQWFWKSILQDPRYWYMGIGQYYTILFRSKYCVSFLNNTSTF